MATPTLAEAVSTIVAFADWFGRLGHDRVDCSGGPRATNFSCFWDLSLALGPGPRPFLPPASFGMFGPWALSPCGWPDARISRIAPSPVTHLIMIGAVIIPPLLLRH